MKIENVHNRHYTLHYFHHGKNAAETSRIICEIYGEHIVSISESTYQFWFQDFENFNVNDKSRCGRLQKMKDKDLEALYRTYSPVVCRNKTGETNSLSLII